MKLRHSTAALGLCAAAALLAGCASAPRPLQGDYSEITPVQAGQSGQVGDRVRWGGEIVQVETRADRSCFELLGKPLLGTARPRTGDVSEGRFFACRSGFYDPALFAPGRDMTVTGRIDGFEERPIGEYNYRYPRVEAEVLYLWPERIAQQPAYYHPYGVWPYYPAGFWSYYYRPFYRPVRTLPRPALPQAQPRRSDS